MINNQNLVHDFLKKEYIVLFFSVLKTMVLNLGKKFKQKRTRTNKWNHFLKMKR